MTLYRIAIFPLVISILILKTNTCLPQDSTMADPVAVQVLYFHQTVRCLGCLKIEKFAGEAVQYFFEKELREGRILWKSIDYQLEGNQWYEKHYRVENQALIISLSKGGREIEWRRLDKVWELLDDHRAFQEYVRKNVRAFLRRT